MKEIVERYNFLKEYNITLKEIDIGFEISKINGIIFIYCKWNGSSVARFKHLLNSLIIYDKSSVYIFDFDSDDLWNFVTKNKFPDDIWGGYGETFWVKEGKIIGYMGKNFNQELALSLCDKVFNSII